MKTVESSEKKKILYIIHQINKSWLNHKYDRIGEFLSDKVVNALPGSATRIVGRESYVQSYRDYDQTALTIEFKRDEPQIDIVGKTAVAICPFFVVYKLDEKTFRERGNEILVFEKTSEKWVIVWRTMHSETAQ